MDPGAALSAIPAPPDGQNIRSVFFKVPGLPMLAIGSATRNRSSFRAPNPNRRYCKLKPPAAVRFLWLEPLLGPLEDLDLSGIHWVIVGGESGPGARPIKAKWGREIRKQCRAAGVPFFSKQWGGAQKKRNGRLLRPDVGRDAEGPSARTGKALIAASFWNLAFWPVTSSICAMGRSAPSVIAGRRTVSGMDRMCCWISGAKPQVTVFDPAAFPRGSGGFCQQLGELLEYLRSDPSP
jgi:hypothetical protein